jgi:hypothetical protein
MGGAHQCSPPPPTHPPTLTLTPPPTHPHTLTLTLTLTLLVAQAAEVLEGIREMKELLRQTRSVGRRLKSLDAVEGRLERLLASQRGGDLPLVPAGLGMV